MTAILDRSAIAPMVVMTVAAWIVIAFSPMAHEPVQFLIGWAVMCTAMMLPTVFRAGEYAAAGSASRAASFAIGYLTVWLCSAPFAYALINGVQWSSVACFIAAIAVGVYQFTPIARRALAKCHERRRCGRPVVFGAKQGVACLVACFPLMVLTMVFLELIHANVLVTIGLLVLLTVAMMFEKRRPAAAVALGVALIAVASVAFVQVTPGGQPAHLHEQQVGVSG